MPEAAASVLGMSTLTVRSVAAAALAAALLLTGCAAGAPPEPSTPSASAPSPTSAETSAPSPTTPSSALYSEPGETPPQQAGLVTFGGTGGHPEMAVIAGPALLDGDFRVEGRCEGTAATFEVLTAEPGDSGRSLATGRIDCDDPDRPIEFSSRYAGPVQVSFRDTDGVTRAWARVIVPG